jgi:predicted DCC family thiol-disulfide oxidoreductase YuxK
MLAKILRTSARSISRRPTDNQQPFVVSVVLFDGLCGLCSRIVQFLLQKDRHQLLKFAPLQGDTARAVFARYPNLGASTNLRSVIYLREFNSPEEEIYVRSDAILSIFDDVEATSGWVRLMRFMPRFMREMLYTVVARFRYSLFGKFNQCWLPDLKVSERFLP